MIARDYSDKDLRAALGSSPPLEKMKMGHTPTPWRLQHLGPQEADLIAKGTFMGLSGGSGAPSKYDPDDAAQWDIDADFLLKAVNCHDELVEALDKLAYAVRRARAYADELGASGEDSVRDNGWRNACSRMAAYLYNIETKSAFLAVRKAREAKP